MREHVGRDVCTSSLLTRREREFFIDNLLVRIHRCFCCTGLAPWEFESPFPGSVISTFLGCAHSLLDATSHKACCAHSICCTLHVCFCTLHVCVAHTLTACCTSESARARERERATESGREREGKRERENESERERERARERARATSHASRTHTV